MWTPEHVHRPSSQLVWSQSVHHMWNQLLGSEQHSLREVGQVLVIRCSGAGDKLLTCDRCVKPAVPPEEAQV